MIRRVLGLMSGTSLDGVDAAIIETDGEKIAGFGPAASRPYSLEEREALAGAVETARKAKAPAAADFARSEKLLTQAHAELAEDLLAQDKGAGAPPVDLAGFPGQTLVHRPQEGFTLQIGDGAALARRLKLAVAADFRSADVRAGGQGAPLAPLYHRARAARDGGELPLCVLNIGGVANLTWIGAEGELLAFDTGPGGGLLDDWTRRRCGASHDRDGALAARGEVHREKLAALLADPFFARPPPKSLDRHDVSADSLRGLSAPDGAATLTAFTAHAAGRAERFLPAAPRQWIVTGGGRHNPVLMEMLAEVLNAPVRSAEAKGWRGDMIEAEAFAYLAVRVLRKLPLSLPETTGAPRPLAGGRLYRAA